MPRTLADELEGLRIAWLDFCYALLAPTVGRVADRFGLKPRQWVIEARKRANA